MNTWSATCPVCGKSSSAVGEERVVLLAMRMFYEQHRDCTPDSRAARAIKQIDTDTVIAMRQIQAQFDMALEVDRQFNRLFDQQRERLRQQFAEQRSDYYNQLCDQWLAAEQAMGLSQGGRHV